MMPQPATPREVFHQLVDGVAKLVAGDAGQAGRLAGLYAEQTHVTHPMAVDDTPLLTRAELRDHFAAGPGAAPATFAGFHADDIVVHETPDPEVIVAEFTYRGDGTGAPFAVRCVFVIRVRDGQIVESRDYADHAAFARIRG
jgi:ketosteroid isomerase-like protein